MKGLDTNILARYLRDDDIVQSAKAARLMQRAINENQPLFINHVVLCDLTWILTSVYDHTKNDLIEMIEKVLAAEYLELEDRNTVQSALEDYKSSKADFADCLIGRNNLKACCEFTLTFDRRLRPLQSFRVH